MKISITKHYQDANPITVDVGDFETGLAEFLKTAVETICSTDGITRSGEKISTTVCPSLTRDVKGQRLPEKCEARKINMWSPAVFDGGGKKRANVLFISCLTYDIDHQTRADMGAVLDRVTASGYASIIHTTHSHDPAHDDFCMRVSLKLTTPLDVRAIGFDKVRAFYEQVAVNLGIPFDPQTADCTRIFFKPSVPKGGPKYFFKAIPGRSVDYFDAAPQARGAAASGEPEAGVVYAPSASGAVLDIGAMFERILRGKLEPEWREAFKRARDGKPWAAWDSHMRDNTIYTCASKAVFFCYDAPLEALLELFRPGCNAMDAEAKRTDPDGRSWLQKAEFDLERGIERREAERTEYNGKMAVAREGGFRASAISVPEGSQISTDAAKYTLADLKIFYEKQGCKDEIDFKSRWVIRFHGANWIFENGLYSCAISDLDMDMCVGRNLARSPIEFTKSGVDGGKIDIPWNKAIKPYTSVAEKGVQGSFMQDESRYDPVDRIFFEAVCPPRKLPPEYDAEVEEWFKRFNNKDLIEWLSAFPKLNNPTALLYLKGPEGIGKTLLPMALSRLWTKKGPTKFHDVFGTAFNSALQECPLIFADEGIPKVPGIMDEIRQMVGNDHHSLNRKFMPTVAVQGFIRMIASGNNENILNTSAELGNDDVGAVAKRILYVDCTGNTAPREWILQLTKEKTRAHISAWIEQDKVIKHVLWMSQNTPVPAFDRTIGGGSRSFAENLSTTAGYVPPVLEFMARYLSLPNSQRQSTKLARIGNGELLISTELLADQNLWNAHVPARRVLPADKISAALAQVRSDAREVDGTMYHVIRVSTLLEWMKKNQVGNFRDVQARIEAKV